MVACCFLGVHYLLVFILAVADLTVAELFSSVSHLKHLGNVEFELISASRDYVAKSSVLLLNPEYIAEYPKIRQEYLEEISSFIEEVEPISTEAVQDMSSHVSHPIHVYQLIRRFVTFWNKLKTLVDWKAGGDIIKLIRHSSMYFPSDGDLASVRSALLRLQSTYRIDVTSISEGTIFPLKKTITPPFSVDECYRIAMSAMNMSDFHHSVIWLEKSRSILEQTTKQQKESDDNGVVSMEDVLRMMAAAQYNGRNQNRAYKITKELLETDPQNDLYKKDRDFYHKKAAVSKQRLVDEPQYPKRVELSQFEENYEKACRRSGKQSPRLTKYLRCFYTSHHPNIVLAPVKTEEVYKKPLVLIFHDLLSAKEVALFKEISSQKLELLIDEEQSEDERFNESSKLSNEDFLKVGAIIPWFFESIDVEREFRSYEAFAVRSSGIGQRYSPHHMIDTVQNDGNHLATLLVYLSTVEYGGGTVFPLLRRVNIPAVEGSAVYFHNTYSSGRHTSKMNDYVECPVLLGEQWTMTKWYKTHAQKLHRDSKLSRTHR